MRREFRSSRRNFFGYRKRLGSGQLVAPVVVGVVAMPLDPVIGHGVGGNQGQQLLPQVHVQRRFPIGLDPPPALPLEHPAFAQSVDHVPGVGIQLHLAGHLQLAQGLDNGGEFHAVVGGGGFTAGEYLFLPLI